MSLLLHDRYGGRHGRYKNYRGRLLELLDPWDRKTLQFCSEWVYDLWLWRRADPETRAIVVRPEPLPYLKLGHRGSGVADLAITTPAGVTTYELLLPADHHRANRRVHDLRHAAEVRGFLWKTTSIIEIERHSELIRNMDRIRQELVIWLDHRLCGIKKTVIEALANGPKTRAQVNTHVAAALGGHAVSQVDVAIFHLFFDRKLTLDLHRRISHETVITRL